MKAKKKWSLDFEQVPVSELRVDLSYQRPVDKRYLKIAQSFDELLFRPLQVSKRVNNKYYVIDGAHRLAAVKHLGIKAVPCEVYEGISLNDERHMFANQDKGRVAVSALIKFKAEARIPNSVSARLLEFFTENEMPWEPVGTQKYMRALGFLKRMMEANQEDVVEQVCQIYNLVPQERKNENSFWHNQFTRAVYSTLIAGEEPHNVIAVFELKSADDIWREARTTTVGNDLVHPISRIIQREIAGLPRPTAE